MRGDVDTIKERLNIVDLVSGYVKLDKAGASFKGRCPFHNEKTPSFFVSPVRQNYYCFGCGAKGDIFSFVEAMEGLDFLGALKLLAEKAGVEIEYQKGESKTEKDKILNVLEETTLFFEKELKQSKSALQYLAYRGVTAESLKSWRIGYAPAKWRLLHNHLQTLGFDVSTMLKAGLVKTSDTSHSHEPYDVFRDRLTFPLFDQNGQVIAFSGRALTKETEPKYLNSPDTVLFTKSEVLYGLNKAKVEIRKKNYTVLVEGQMDLILSHQAGINNTVASSGTAFTRLHLERLRHLSSRIILAFDGDLAGEKAAEKASNSALSLGFEVKIADLPQGLDPAEMIEKNPKDWKEVLRQALPAVEFFFNRIEKKEKDPRKLGKQIEQRILPMLKLIQSAIEQSHFVSMLAKRTGIKEEIIWEDLRKTAKPDLVQNVDAKLPQKEAWRPLTRVSPRSHRETIEERLSEIKLWQKELPKSAPEALMFKKEEAELLNNLSNVLLRDDLNRLSAELSRAEATQNSKLIKSLTLKIQKVHKQIRILEEKRKIL